MRGGLLLVLCAAVGVAHVGVNDVFFEGMAGPYPLYVTVRPPLVIPGVAEISIRSAAKDVESIRITPMTLTGAGSKYPPTPDEAVRSREDGQLFTGGLWIMGAGSWQVRATVKGARGEGQVSVPVPAASRQTSTMDPVTGGVLLVLMALLTLGVVGIAGAAVREAQLGPGEMVDGVRKKRGVVAMGVGLTMALVVIWLGRGWWEDEARAYARSLYRPMTMEAAVEGDVLLLKLAGSGWMRGNGAAELIADHGHLMHAYLMRAPGIDAVYHVHPERQGPMEFAGKLPAMPAGEYRVFADVVHANGFPETMTAVVRLGVATVGPGGSVDDAGAIVGEKPVAVWGQGGRVEFEPGGRVRAGSPVTLRFRIVDRDGNPAANLRSYLGMPAHLGVVKKDFSVFAHLHPAGNISMAAYEMAQASLVAIPADVVGSAHSGREEARAEFGFPFGFPSAGSYRLVLQFAHVGGIETTAFDLTIN
jgi:hypothetical protein